MTYKHGVSTQESSSYIPAQVTVNGLPVVFGVAPINQVPAEKRPVNKPVLCYTQSEAVTQLGFDSDFSNYTICEAITIPYISTCTNCFRERIRSSRTQKRRRSGNT